MRGESGEASGDLADLAQADAYPRCVDSSNGLKAVPFNYPEHLRNHPARDGDSNE